MMRQSSSRNHRPKGGVRLKHVLQICLLLAICTWLIYQVKHSHDKKRAYEERFARISSKVTERQTDPFDFGRKGLPLVNDNNSVSLTRAKEEDNEEGEEQVGNEEAKRDGDDDVNEQDQDRSDGENEQEEEFAGEDEKDGQVEEDALFDNEEREDSAQEAREENYKRDDASSAVVHDGHVVDTAKGFDGEQEIEDSRVGDNTTLGLISAAAFGENATVTNVEFASNGNYSVSKVGAPEIEFTKTENGSISTRISTEGGNQTELQPNLTMAALPENNLEVTAAATVNVSDTPPLYQNRSKLDEGTGLIPVQNQSSLVNEISREVPVQKSDEGSKSEIHPQNTILIEK